MPNFSNLRVDLELNIRKFSSAMNSARRMAQDFSTKMADASRQGDAQRLVDGYTRLSDRLHKVGLGLKDIARITSGIMISQTFYAITGAIKDATDALWEFNESLDYAHITYSSLFGDTALAGNFIETLKQFSVDTIFEYSDIEGMARKLSAYGIEYQNLMYIIEGLTNIGTISGDTAALERLAVAIGQINAKGTLKAEELRQLANAYTPIYDILRTKLGLTEEELNRVGDLGISSADAINAIIEYANETFGATADAATQTITGINNRIVDRLKVMGADIMQPITRFYKSLASYISNQLDTIHAIYQEKGLGGVFEYLVPDEEWRQRIRSFIASIKNFISSIVSLITTLWPYVKQIAGGIIDAFTIFIGVVNVAIGSLVGTFKALASNEVALEWLTRALITAAAAWVLFKIQAMGAMVIGTLKVLLVDTAKAVLFLTKAITANPLMIGLILLGAVLIGLSSKADSANSAVSRLVNALNSYSAGGSTADDILQTGEAMSDAAGSAEDFWNAMGEGAANAGDEIDKTGNKAKKASKSLLSFDEVFRLDEADDSSGMLGDLEGLKDLTDAFSGLGSGILEGLDIPDFSEYADNFIGALYNDLWESIKKIATGGAVGALIGGLAGFALGAFVTRSMSGALAGARFGTRIGALAGGAFAGFWTEAYDEMESSLLKIATGGAIGVLVGGLLGMVIGAFATKSIDGALLGAKLGAGVGGLIGSGIGGFWSLATEEMSNAIEGALAGAAAGGLAGGLAGLILGAYATRTLAGAMAGARLGAGIGTLLGGALAAFWGNASDEMKASIVAIATGAAEGALAGGLVGLVLGAYATRTLAGAMAGARLGAGIGRIMGAAFGYFWQNASEELKANITAITEGATYGALAGAIMGLVIGAFATRSLRGALAGARLGTMVGSGVGALLTVFFGEAKDGIAKAIEDNISAISAMATGAFIGGVAGMVIGGIIGAFLGGLILPGAKIGARLGTALGALGGWVYQSLKDAGIIENVGEWLSNMFSSVGEALNKLGLKVSDWWQNIWKPDGPNKWKSAWSSVKSWFNDFFNDMKQWFTDIGKNISEWWNSLWDGKNASVDLSTSANGGGARLRGHATGGIFSREHIARFAEGNKAEAVIPLEDKSAMMPFVTAISDGILQGLLPAMVSVNGNGGNQLPPMYVGTLIGDERGLQQLFKKFEVYEAKELARKGLS